MAERRRSSMTLKQTNQLLTNIARTLDLGDVDDVHEFIGKCNNLGDAELNLLNNELLAIVKGRKGAA